MKKKAYLFLGSLLLGLRYKQIVAKKNVYIVRIHNEDESNKKKVEYVALTYAEDFKSLQKIHKGVNPKISLKLWSGKKWVSQYEEALPLTKKEIEESIKNPSNKKRFGGTPKKYHKELIKMWNSRKAIWTLFSGSDVLEKISVEKYFSPSSPKIKKDNQEESTASHVDKKEESLPGETKDQTQPLDTSLPDRSNDLQSNKNTSLIPPTIKSKVKTKETKPEDRDTLNLDQSNVPPVDNEKESDIGLISTKSRSTDQQTIIIHPSTLKVEDYSIIYGLIGTVTSIPILGYLKRKLLRKRHTALQSRKKRSKK